MNEEVWKDVKDYEGLYQVSNFGKVKRVGRNHNRKFNISRYGYALVNLYKNGTYKNISVHRIVATAFIPNPYNKEQVNHKNGDKLNNCVDNLEWCTPKENVTHSYKSLGRRGVSHNSRFTGKNHWASKKTIQRKKDGTMIKIWDSQKEASKTLGIAAEDISRCCCKKRKTAGGYLWETA